MESLKFEKEYRVHVYETGLYGKLDPAGEQGETSHCFRIKASDLDINLHTNNSGYLRWANDTYDFGFLMKYDPQSVEINYLAESKYGEEIMIRSIIRRSGFMIIQYTGTMMERSFAD